MIKKHLIAVFINTAESGASAPKWTRIKKSTELTIVTDPQTEEMDYIADENATEELTGYKVSLSQALKMLKGEPDFLYFWDRFYELKVGNEAKTDYLIVFMFDKEGEGVDAKYKAWSGDTTISFNELNAVDSELNFDLLFGGNIKKGTCSVSGTAPDYVPVFTETTETDSSGTTTT